MPRARARQFFSSGLGFGLETQKPGLGLGLGLETCWTRTRTRVLRIWTRTRTRTRDMRTRTRLGLEETKTRCISAELYEKFKNFHVNVFTLEVTTLGFISDFRLFQNRNLKNNLSDQILSEFSKTAISESYALYCERNSELYRWNPALQRVL